MSWYSLVMQHLAMLIAGIFAVIAAAISAFFLNRRWVYAIFIGLLVLMLAFVFLWFLPNNYHPDEFLSEYVPPLFYDQYFLILLLCILGVIFGALGLFRLFRIARQARRPQPSTDGPDVGDQSLEAAWEQILARLKQLNIDITVQKTYLMIAPEPEWAGRLIEASGVQVLSSAPDAPAPIHAYVTPHGVLFDIAGVSCFGSQDVGSVPRLESFCRKILAQRPDCPILRGIITAFPAAWLERPDSVEAARAVRTDLQTITRIFQARCPVSVLIPGMETVSGFSEFLARIPADLIPRRCGYSVVPPQPLSNELAQRIMTYMTRWFYGYGLEAMFWGRKPDATVEPSLDQAGNSRIFSFDHTFRRLRPKLRGVLENAFPYHPDLEPVLFQGCYFLATGHSPAERAFAAGLIRDRNQGIFSDQRYAAWTQDARIGDGYYKRWAIAVGLVGGSICALVWLYLLRDMAPPWYGAFPLALACLWVYAIIRFCRM